MKYLVLFAFLGYAAATACPGGQVSCPGSDTCCAQSEAGQYGCCKFPKATCCSDHLHCCPQGYRCDLANSTCQRALDDGSMLTVLSAKQHEAMPHVMTTEEKAAAAESNPEHHHESAVGTACPGGQVSCPGSDTCCAQSEAGQYGCCKFPQATCCSDHLHCCPQGYRCDLANSTCQRALDDGSMLTVLSAKQHEAMPHVMTTEEKAAAAESNPEHHHEHPQPSFWG